MTDEITYLEEDGAGGYAMHKVRIDEHGQDRKYAPETTYTIQPWEKDSQWTSEAFERHDAHVVN